MANKLLVLGNGFDIDLGLKTKYSDFARSKFWDDLMKDVLAGLSNDLLSDLKKANETEAWFDIEQVMYDYVTSLSDYSYDASKDKSEFNKLQNALMKYLEDVQNDQTCNNDCYAYRVLKEMSNSGSLRIYTFNYTNVCKLAEYCGLKVESSMVTHMHGALENKGIILGILADSSVSIRDEYSFMYKDNSRFYMPNKMYDDFDKANEIVFFGHSINGMDFPYFKDFFIKQSGMAGDYKRKNITIFTYNDDSDIQIRNSIRRAKVDLTQLFRRNNIQFIQTKRLYDEDAVEVEKYNAFVKRMRNDGVGTVIVRRGGHFPW